MDDRVITNIKDGVAEVELNRPNKHNALDHNMFESIIEVGDQLAKDSSLRAVILYGAGKSFCAGIDLSMLAGEGSSLNLADKMKPRKGSLSNYYQSAAYVWREIPVPVIAVLHGAVYGGGLQIALGADIRYAEKNTSLSIMEAKWGIIPDMGIMTSLPNLMKMDQALEIAMTAEIKDASEALQLGLITAIKDNPLEQARELAKKVSNKSPDVIRSIKRLFYEAWLKDDQFSLSLEAQLQQKVMTQSNHLEATKSTLTKSKPKFLNSKL